MNIYVFNLGSYTSDDDLRKLFEPFGRVSSAKVIADLETGRSRRFGFVEMDSNTEANLAISKLNGKESEHRVTSFTLAGEKESHLAQFSGHPDRKNGKDGNIEPALSMNEEEVSKQ